MQNKEIFCEVFLLKWQTRVVDAETIQVKIRDADVVIDGKLC